MNLLLDTHVALWALTDDKRLSEETRALIEDADNHIYISAASVWEIAVKYQIHRENMPISGKRFSAYCKKAGYYFLSIDISHVAQLENLSQNKNSRHKDPFDRILIAQAQRERFTLLTHDRAFLDYKSNQVRIV